jgi:Transglutaminase-like superfamily
MLAHLSRARRLSGREWMDLTKAQLAILGAEGALRTRSRGRLLAYDHSAQDVPVASDHIRRAQELALAVSRAAEFGVLRPKCLARSVALHRLLRAEGIAGSRIRIGVRPQAGRLTAHAWVTLSDRILGDDPAFVARFAEIADARMAEFA